MENHQVSSKEIVKFYYDKTTRRPKKLENNVFVLYSPERFKLQPGERITINMNVKINFSKNIEGSCTILYSLSNYGLKLLNSSNISHEYNSNVDNFLNVDADNLPPWVLIFDLYNKSFTQTLQVRKKQEIGYFFITNDRGKEIDFKFVKVT